MRFLSSDGNEDPMVVERCAARRLLSERLLSLLLSAPVLCAVGNNNVTEYGFSGCRVYGYLHVTIH